MPDMENRTDAPTPSPSPSPSPSVTPEPRQAPQFGEYAPEGWSWSPESAGVGPAPVASTRTVANESTPSGSSVGQVPGVPHNLGARSGTTPPAAPAAPAEQREPHDPRSQSPDSAPSGTAYRAGMPPQQPSARRPVDRVVTIILLVLGAVGALYFAASMQQLPASLTMLAAALGIDGFTLPDSVQTIGMIGALTVFALYAVSLIFAIQRMRRGKISFWVPLVAGVLAFIVVFAFTAFALGQTPELMQSFTDPDAMQRILDYLGEVSQTTP